MDLFKSMESFVRVAQAGSFSAAAIQLSASRAIVSKHIKDLEDHLGARLLYRTTRRLSLTEIGFKHFTFCARVLKEMRAEHEETKLLQHKPRGEIKLMAPKSFGNEHLAPIIAEFVERHDGIKVAMLLSDDSPGGMNLIENGVDLAIRLSEVPSSSMVARRIGSLRWVLCAAPSYLKARGIPRLPDDLTAHDCLLHLKYFPEGEWCLTEATREWSIKVSGRFAANSSLALRAGALGRLGIAPLPLFSIEDELRTRRLVEVLGDYRLPIQPIFALYPQQRLLTAKVRLLLDFLVERFSGPTPAVRKSRRGRRAGVAAQRS